MRRRRFLKVLGVGATTMAASSARGFMQPAEKASASSRYDDWIEARVDHVINKGYVDAFLNAGPNNQWAKFDPELGYVLKDSIQRDGIDGSHSIYRYETSGARKMVNFADRPCRINTYGDSFTQCHQVSDGETWQEYLAAHLGEPIRNFGVGGYGVFQAYRRMLRVEKRPIQAKNVILNIWGDDHHRSLMPWRTFHINSIRHEEMFHGNPWTHLAVNLTTGQFEERPNPCPTPESLHNLCSAEFVIETFGGHPIVQLRAMMERVPDVDQSAIRKLADWAGFTFDFSDSASRSESAKTLFDIMAYKSTLHLLAKLRQFAADRERNVLVMLTHPGGKVAKYISGNPRSEHDLWVLADLEEHGPAHFDSLDIHKQDFQQFRITPRQYVDRYYIGHYRPQGNHFLAYAIKDNVVEWLDPKSITYQGKGSIIRFNDGRYLD